MVFRFSFIKVTHQNWKNSTVLLHLWLKGELGEMKIELNLDANLIKKRLYRLSPSVKQKVREEIDKMLAAG